jgi:hypothetical protein
MVPEKVGLKGVTRDGMDYEFTLVFDLDIKHVANASKDRTGLFMDKIARVLSSQDAKRIKVWCESGVHESQVIVAINKCANVDELRNVYLNFPGYQQRLNQIFVDRKNALQKAQQTIEISSTLNKT